MLRVRKDLQELQDHTVHLDRKETKGPRDRQVQLVCFRVLLSLGALAGALVAGLAGYVRKRRQS